ncbi:MAG: efflux transporter outer membrane subunit [Desulfamplus sp.]|nr:efflux transporter outer membrane subunit [Desulfamplus sp.]
MFEPLLTVTYIPFIIKYFWNIGSFATIKIGLTFLSNKTISILILIILTSFLSSCRNIIPEPENPHNTVLIPNYYYNLGQDSSLNVESYIGVTHQPLKSQSSKPEWWESFGSSELNSLIETSLGENFTLKEAWARLKQAKAAHDSQNSSLFPSINFNASASRKTLETTANTGILSSGGSSSSSYSSFSAGPGASYEIDLWGNINARILEYESRTMAARFDVETSAISVAAEISNNWVELITVRETIALVKQQIEINTMLLELLELRFVNSMSTALDVLQQREVVAKSRARIPPLEIREANLLNAIALLCGKSSRKEIFITTPTLGEISHIPQTGIPANLLSNRPDIKSAAFRLTASKWALFQARADRLPSLTLNGSFLLQHTSLENILKNWIFTLASTLNATLFDGGKNSAAIDLASGVMDERLASYQKTVFAAIMEVENSIAAETQRIKWIQLLKIELATAKLALEEARNRYIKGIDSFIQVVTEELNVQNLEINLLEQKAALFKDRISLFRALGGGLK